ncbi:MAG: caspase domain protein, partial [Gemmatimonadetes bacterium]|nr:caspase domain protein [Gemmatimonadota bacterium]
MERAAVLIGVRKSGGLPKLQAVAQGLRDVADWARMQPGMSNPVACGKNTDGSTRFINRVEIITDSDGAPVTIERIKGVIKCLCASGIVEQLVVYFSGHGVNIRHNEYWLLSEAPDDPDAAVNVSGSVQLARYCGIPHVVLISDACRTAAEGIRAQSVEGSFIFPNSDADNEPGCVDVFYASSLGKPSLEVKDVRASAVGFQAVYTQALVHALSGGDPSLIETDQWSPSDSVGHVRAWPLLRHLRSQVPTTIAGMGVPGSVSQRPDAIIASPSDYWLSEVALDAGGKPAAFSGRMAMGAGEAGPPAGPSLLTAVQKVLARMFAGEPFTEASLLPIAVVKGGAAYPAAIQSISRFDGPTHFETGCGFKVFGTGVRRAIAATGVAELLDPMAGVLRLSGFPGPATNVLLEFDDRRGALLPAIAGFIATVVWVDGEIVNVTYEPSANSDRWQRLSNQLETLRNLRSVVAAAAQFGVFRLEQPDNAAQLIALMRSVKAVDPTMAVYAAYALHDLQRTTEIIDTARFMRDDLGMCMFDLCMLTRRPGVVSEGTRTEPMPMDVFPAVPVLSQGWALLDALHVGLPPS